VEATAGITNPFLVAGFGSYRGQNTILKGGFLDDKMSTGLGAKSRAKYRPFALDDLYGKSINPLGPQGANQFLGGTNIFGKPTKRGKRLAAGRKSCS
jgi:hypothetical protein